VTRRALLAGLLVAVLLLPAGAVSAQESLDAGEVDSADFPTLEVVASTPGNAGESPDFTVTEGDEEITPTVEALSAGSLDVVLAIDTSGSMSGAALVGAKTAANEFISLLPTQARVAVIGFGASPTVATGLVADRAVVEDAIAGLTAGGETALYDAVVASALQLGSQSPDTRTALVVLSDGGDTVSGASLDGAADIAAAGFDVVHAVSLVSAEQDRSSLDRIVSGGGSVAEAVDPVALSAVFGDVADRIVNQYRLRWETSLEADGSVDIRFAGTDGTYVATRSVDIDETVVTLAPASEPSVAPPPTAPPAPAITVPIAAENPGTLGWWVLGFGMIFLAVSLFIAGLVLFGPRQKTRNLAKEFRQRMPRGRELTGASRRLVVAVENFLRRDPDRQAGLALRLERAGLDWTPAEFGAVVVAGAAILALLGFAFFGFLGFLIAPAIGVLGSLAVLDSRAQKRKRMFTSQLDATLQLIAGSLRSGFGVVQALDTVAQETEWPTEEEFTRVLGEVRLGRDMGDALHASAVRVDSEDYYWVVQAIEISREVGGNLAEVLDNVSGTIRQRNTLRRQVQALSAEGRMSAIILFALPFVMLAWMRFSNPDYVNLLFDRTGGQISLVVAVGLMAIGAFWMRKIVQIKF